MNASGWRHALLPGLLRMVLLAGIGGCQGSVDVLTAPGAMIERWSGGRVAATMQADEEGWASLPVAAGDAVRASIESDGDVLVYAAALDVRPHEALILELPGAGRVSERDPLSLVVDTPWPAGTIDRWVGVFECASGGGDGVSYTVSLASCEGEVTPVALALDGLGAPLAFQMLSAEPVARLEGATRRLDGEWRTDWSPLRLDVEGTQEGEVFVELSMGGWVSSQLQPGLPFSVALRIPPSIARPGALRVVLVERELTWQEQVFPGERITVDFANAPALGPASTLPELTADAARTVWLEAVVPSDDATESWDIRAPVPSALPPWNLASGLGLGGYVSGLASEMPYRHVRASGDTSRGHFRGTLEWDVP